MKKYDVIIIGSGASGCMTAITTKSKNVAIIDSNYTIAKKLLVTGNGKCNLSNLSTTSKQFNIDIDNYMKQFGVCDTLNFFENLGLLTYADNENRVYPISNSAKSVVDILTNSIPKYHDIYLNTSVSDIAKTEYGFKVSTDTQDFECKKLVIASGGNTLVTPLTDLGVKFTKISPSLVALHTNSTNNLNNLRVSNVKVTATCDNVSKSDFGEILFKESGISGIVIFNLSTLFARHHNFNGTISIDLLPTKSIAELNSILNKRKSQNVLLSKIFVGIFQNQLADEILRQSKLNTNISSKDLSDNDILMLANTIKNLTFTVDGYYNNNQVISGGVPITDLTHNLEYKNIPNLYFTGEICDVDGECGGYNLQWAWTSGHIVGGAL